MALGFRLFFAWSVVCLCGFAQESETKPPPAAPDRRAYGVLPNYRTADVSVPFEKIGTRRKLSIAMRDSTDWPIFGTAAVFSLVYHAQDQNPSFGQGTFGYGKRLATSLVDQAVGNFMTEGVMPALLHQDPRYFPKLTGSKWLRTLHAMSAVLVCRNDSGRRSFNFSEIFGNSVAAAASNAYYPDTRTASDNAIKLGLQVGTDALSNVMKEFWPDVKRRLQKRKER